MLHGDSRLIASRLHEQGAPAAATIGQIIPVGVLTVGLFSNRDAHIGINPIGIHNASHFVMPG